MAERGEFLERELFPGVEAGEEPAYGYAYRFPGDEVWTANVLDFVAAERKCCPLFTFEVVFAPHGKSPWLRMQGLEAIKAFVRDRLHGADGLVPLT